MKHGGRKGRLAGTARAAVSKLLNGWTECRTYRRAWSRCCSERSEGGGGSLGEREARDDAAGRSCASSEHGACTVSGEVRLLKWRKQRKRLRGGRERFNWTAPRSIRPKLPQSHYGPSSAPRRPRRPAFAVPSFLLHHPGIHQFSSSSSPTRPCKDRLTGRMGRVYGSPAMVVLQRRQRVRVARAARSNLLSLFPSLSRPPGEGDVVSAWHGAGAYLSTHDSWLGIGLWGICKRRCVSFTGLRASVAPLRLLTSPFLHPAARRAGY